MANFNIETVEENSSISESFSVISSMRYNDYHNQTLMRKGSYYDWGKAVNGFGYCYKWASNGKVLNQGQPVENRLCERRMRSNPKWGKAVNGWGYCYRYTPYGVVMNEGQPIENRFCERRDPSYFDWGTAVNGYTYCYQYTGNGYTMNEGQPVEDYFCEY